MSSQTPTLKRHNHRVHPCKDEKKESLLQLLLIQNTDKKIIVATSTPSQLSTEQKNVSILSDEELIASPDAKCDMLISYDLPSKAIKYMARIAHTTTYALILVNPSEEKLLHPIETLIGRTLMQELIEGFSEVVIAKTAQPTKKDFDPREERKRKFLDDGEKPKKPREDKKSYADKKPYADKDKKPYTDKDKKPWGDKPKKSYSDDSKGDKKPWPKKERQESKFLGKDENGKAIFSGKSGDRNHHFDGTSKTKQPKLTGKTISIKGKTKKETK